MRAVFVFVAAVLALAVVRAHSTGDMMLFSDELDTMPNSVSSQRALMQAGTSVPYYSPSPSPSPSPSTPVCVNSNLPSQIVARVAILQFARPGTSTDANYGVRLYVRALFNAYRDQNRLFGTRLRYSVKNYVNPGIVTNPAQIGRSTQGWFFYYIVLDIGRCGTYKPTFINTLRNLIRKPRPGGSQIKRLRVINY